MKNSRVTITLLIVSLGGIIYTGTLLIYYAFIANEYVGGILSSYERYIFSYLLGISFTFLLFLAIKTQWRWEFKKLNPLTKEFLMMLSFIVIFAQFNFIFNQTKEPIQLEIFEARKSVEISRQERAQYNNALIWSDYLTNENYKPYIISQTDRGFDMLMISYTLFPSQIEWTGIYNFSISTEPYYPKLGDPWTMIISPNDWAKYVKDNNFDIVYIFKYDDKFKKTYGHFFDQLENNALYKVTENNSGNLELISIPKP